MTPAELRIGRQALTVLARVLAQAAPREGCALLLGGRLQEGERRIWRLEWIWPCLNVWEPAGERRRRFRVDPRELLLAQKWGRARGLELLGSAHSHPGGTAVPSASDLALTAGPTLMLIQDAAGSLAAWWLPDPDTRDGQPRPLVWKMED